MAAAPQALSEMRWSCVYSFGSDSLSCTGGSVLFVLLTYHPGYFLYNKKCISVYFGLVLLLTYRIIAWALSPSIGIKQCLSSTGYSFFAWNFALLCAYPFEIYKDSLNWSFQPILVPLLLIGIPSSLAQVSWWLVGANGQ